MDETKRGIVIIDILGDEPEGEGFGIETKPEPSKKVPPEHLVPEPALEIVPVAPLKKDKTPGKHDNRKQREKIYYS